MNKQVHVCLGELTLIIHPHDKLACRCTPTYKYKKLMALLSEKLMALLSEIGRHNKLACRCTLTYKYKKLMALLSEIGRLVTLLRPMYLQLHKQEYDGRNERNCLVFQTS
jgi:glutathione peroxidase-family protein